MGQSWVAFIRPAPVPTTVNLPPSTSRRALPAALAAAVVVVLVGACTHPLERSGASTLEPTTGPETSFPTSGPAASAPTTGPSPSPSFGSSPSASPASPQPSAPVTPSAIPSESPVPSPSVSPTPIRTPVETTACDDLTGRGAADAELLVERSLQPGTGSDVVWCMPSRSGIPIVSAETGEIVNHPVRPTFVDAYVDDVQVPMLADALYDGRAWFLEDIWDLPDYLLPIVGKRFTRPEAMAEAVPGWIADALDNADHPSAFPALVVRAL